MERGAARSRSGGRRGTRAESSEHVATSPSTPATARSPARGSSPQASLNLAENLLGGTRRRGDARDRVRARGRHAAHDHLGSAAGVGRGDRREHAGRTACSRATGSRLGCRTCPRRSSRSSPRTRSARSSRRPRPTSARPASSTASARSSPCCCSRPTATSTAASASTASTVSPRSVPACRRSRTSVVAGNLRDEPDLRGSGDGVVSFADFTARRLGLRTRSSGGRSTSPPPSSTRRGRPAPPKCIVHRAGGLLLKHLTEHRLHCDVRADDVVFYFTTCGWMMWNWLVSALASKATIVLFDGSPVHPSPSVLFDVADRHRVTLMGVSAKYIDGAAKAGLRTPRDPSTRHAAHGLLDRLAAVAGRVRVRLRRGEARRAPCVDLGRHRSVWLLRRRRSRPDRSGPVRSKGQRSGWPSMCGTRTAGPRRSARRASSSARVRSPRRRVGFWGDGDGSAYRAAYFERFPGVWAHGDFASWTEHGGMVIHGRSDATLNASGVRIGTAEIYRQVEQLPEVLESIAVGQEWDGDTRIVLFVRLTDDSVLDDALRSRIRQTLRDNCSPASRSRRDRRGFRHPSHPQRQDQRARRHRRRERPGGAQHRGARQPGGPRAVRCAHLGCARCRPPSAFERIRVGR